MTESNKHSDDSKADSFFKEKEEQDKVKQATKENMVMGANAQNIPQPKPVDDKPVTEPVKIQSEQPAPKDLNPPKKVQTEFEKSADNLEKVRACRALGDIPIDDPYWGVYIDHLALYNKLKNHPTEPPPIQSEPLNAAKVTENKGEHPVPEPQAKVSANMERKEDKK